MIEVQLELEVWGRPSLRVRFTGITLWFVASTWIWNIEYTVPGLARDQGLGLPSSARDTQTEASLRTAHHDWGSTWNPTRRAAFAPSQVHGTYADWYRMMILYSHLDDQQRSICNQILLQSVLNHPMVCCMDLRFTLEVHWINKLPIHNTKALGQS